MAHYTRGSSPLTRGKPRLRWRLPCRRGLIPAHAGKTAPKALRSQSRRAHPRSRGENVCNGSVEVFECGSSPLTRGKPDSRSCAATRGRLIPAHAGKTCMSVTWTSTRPAHPRSRGENMRSPASGTISPGSSPLTRGKQYPSSMISPMMRLIPAHAGKTPACVIALMSEGAHPRSRGENQVCPSHVALILGSSPLTRGKPGFRGLRGLRGRLIPAHAGKTSRSSTTSRPRSAHPRSRGENTVA